MGFRARLQLKPTWSYGFGRWLFVARARGGEKQNVTAWDLPVRYFWVMVRFRPHAGESAVVCRWALVSGEACR